MYAVRDTNVASELRLALCLGCDETDDLGAKLYRELQTRHQPKQCIHCQYFIYFLVFIYKGTISALMVHKMAKGNVNEGNKINKT